MKDLPITLEDEPGRLADLGEATGKAGINSEGLCATTGGGRAEVHVLVDADPATRHARSSAGMRSERRAASRCRRPPRHGG
jgi:hypothetical protein